MGPASPETRRGVLDIRSNGDFYLFGRPGPLADIGFVDLTDGRDRFVAGGSMRGPRKRTAAVGTPFRFRASWFMPGCLTGRESLRSWTRTTQFSRREVGRMFTHSYYAAEVMQADTGLPERIFAVPNCYDPGDFADVPDRDTARKQLGLDPDAYIAAYTGHIRSEKAAQDALQFTGSGRAKKLVEFMTRSIDEKR